MQVWLALPTEMEECEPAFDHYAAESIPEFRSSAIAARILIGSAFGLGSPVKTASVTTYLDIQLSGSEVYQPDFPNQQIAIYTLDSHLQVNGEPLAINHLLVLDSNSQITAVSPSRFILLGGEALPDERFILWNFVASSREKLRKAADDWEQQRFRLVPGESEFIPLPK
jgi:redox-sensitive bicupin YhaK (pirin superfamily)